MCCCCRNSISPWWTLELLTELTNSDHCNCSDGVSIATGLEEPGFAIPNVSQILTGRPQPPFWQVEWSSIHIFEETPMLSHLKHINKTIKDGDISPWSLDHNCSYGHMERFDQMEWREHNNWLEQLCGEDRQACVSYAFAPSARRPAYEKDYGVYYVLFHISISSLELKVPGCIRLYHAILGCTWLYLAVFGCTWLYLALPGCIWLYLAVLGSTWLNLTVLGCTWLYLAVLVYARLYMA